MILITGWGSKIASEFRVAVRLYDAFDVIRRAPYDAIPATADRYLFCHGLLRAKRSWGQSLEEVAESYRANCTSITEACDAIIAARHNARICIIGSESAYRGSYDGVYAAAKADLHGYIERVKLRTPAQQIVGISPGIIGDAGMTLRRADGDNLAARRDEHPKHRFLCAREVANLAAFLLYGSDFLSNTVIRMHGGHK